MFWLQTTRNDIHGGGDWGLKQSIWSPSRKKNGAKWPFYESILRVSTGDTIIHLHDIDNIAYFIGYSTVEKEGYETKERPPVPDKWVYAESFYRARIKDFQPFLPPLPLASVLKNQNMALRDYIAHNSSGSKRHISFIVQSDRIQCLQGAYLGELDAELLSILFADGLEIHDAGQSNVLTHIFTSERLTEMRVRVGQQAFSEAIRENYHNQCCFPGCTVRERIFLTGSHIARWADAIELRGFVDNGLCLCLMHDRAFELGLFTLDEAYRVVVNTAKEIVKSSQWCSVNLRPYNGEIIKLGSIPPSIEALKLHRQRTGFKDYLP